MKVLPRLTQVALCTNNVPRSVELLTRGLGFADAGGVCLFGRRLAELQELGDDAAGQLLWLTGRQDFMQVELFHHTDPPQRPLPADWRPSDHGYVRWGVAVSDFDGCLARLAECGVPTITEPLEFGDGVRRVCFRDPYVGSIVEVFEDGPRIPGGVRARHFRADPAVVYAASSVADLAPARAFFGEAVGLEEREPTSVHSAEMEVLWGLAGASVERLVYDAGGRSLEICCYHDPPGRPKPTDNRASDQGMLNVAFGFRTRRELDTLIERLENEGYPPLAPAGAPGAPTATTYVRTGDGTSLELHAVPAEFDHLFGLVPRPSMDVALGRRS